jgi:hypothetical protein
MARAIIKELIIIIITMTIALSNENFTRYIPTGRTFNDDDDDDVYLIEKLHG